MDEMRLIGIAVGERKVCPVHLVPIGDRLNHILKSSHAAEELRRESYFVAEELDKASLAEIGLPRDAFAAEESGIRLEFLDGKGHRRVMFQWTVGNRHQPLFENAELSLNRGRFIEDFEKAPGSFRAPE